MLRLIHETLFESARRHPGRVAIRCEETEITYAALHERARRLARALAERGVERGDRVMFLLENRAECAVALFGTLLAGAAYTFINPQTKLDKLEFLLGDAEPRAIITEPPLASRFAAAFRASPSVRTVLVMGEPAENQESFDAALDRAVPRDDIGPAIPIDLAALIYTSGSTGRPKGVMMTHQNMLFSMGGLTDVFELSWADIILSALPLSFNYGMYQILLTVAAGATLVLERSFTYPAHVVRLIEQRGATVFPGVPTMFARFAALHAKTPIHLPKVRCLTNTAAALSEDLATSLSSIFPAARIFRMYGLTECKRALYLDPALASSRPGSVGKAMPGMETYLLSPEGKPVAPGERGILHVRGPNVMLGYWKLPEETARVLLPGKYPSERVFCTFDWFRTDSDGFFYFLGRTDDIIKCRGEKVSPAEVEGALYGIPGVREAAVIGVPDAVLGEAVWAFVALEAGFDIPEKELRRHCASRLEAHLVPERVIVLNELPKTATGKVSKKELPAVAERYRQLSS